MVCLRFRRCLFMFDPTVSLPSCCERVACMQHAEVLAAIRHLIHDTFLEMGARPPVNMSEHILVRDETYCGRRFRAGDYQAIWFIEEDELKIYSPDGAVVRVMSASHVLRERTSVMRKAA